MTMLPLDEVAPIKRRAIAYIIDAAIGFAISVVVPTIILIVVVMSTRDLLTSLLIAAPLFSILGLAWVLVYTFLQAGRGSIGMRAQGLRLAKATDGSPLGFGRALLRNVIWALAASIVVGYFTVLFDGSSRFQGWHDKVGGAVMLMDSTRAQAAPVHQQDGGALPFLPGQAPEGAAPAAPVGMPGFAAPQAPQAPQTAMPGFAQPSPAGAFAPPAAPGAAPAAPPAVPAHDPQQPEDDEFAEHTVLSPPARHAAPSTPPIHRDLPDDPLISFVPGVTQEPVRPAAAPAPVEPVTPVAEPAAFPAPAAPVAPAAPAAPAAPEDAPAFPAPAAPAPVPAETGPTPIETVAARLGSVPPVAPAPAELASAPQDATAAVPVTAENPVAPMAAPTPSAPLVTDPDEDDIESTRISVPGHRLVFTWDDGQRATVSGRTVFGRNPEERDGAVNVAVRDETRSLSKTHFEAGADARGGWVMDRQSTNGTVIVREGVRIACPPGTRVPVRLGDALEIGDRIVTIGGYV